MIDINKLFTEYITYNEAMIKQKIKEFEIFSKKEDELREYEEALSILEKTNKSVNLEVFTKIKNLYFNYLYSNFDSDNIYDNIERVKSVEIDLKEKETELKKLYETLSFILKNWNSFLKRRGLENKESVFIKEIFEKMEDIRSEFETCDLDGIGRLEQVSDEIKKEITKLINVFEYLYILKEKHIFIGKDAKELEEDITLFLEKDFFDRPILELLKRKESIQSILEVILNKETIYIRKKLPIVKLTSKEKRDLVSFSVKFDNNYILDTNTGIVSEELYDIEELDRYVYLDNYPAYGIFDTIEIGSNLNISLNQYECMIEVEQKSTNIFYTISSISFVLILLSLFDIVNVFFLLTILIFFGMSFKLLFKNLLYKTSIKYNVENCFFFIPINFYIIKEGAYNFYYKELIFNILNHSDNTILKGEKNG